MSLPVPDLDDRRFLDLVAEARRRIQQSTPAWTDLSPHDPGMALIEVFAHLTEIMIYRINRLPEKAYVAFLNLLGASRHPPSAAWVDLVFSRVTPGASAEPVPIPAGTRVAVTRGTEPEPAVFVTAESAVLPAGADEVTVRAHHFQPVDGELIGTGTGQPEQRLQAGTVPMITTAEPVDHLLGVEVDRDSLPEGVAAREFEGRTYEIWQQVTSFAEVGPEARAYLLDRSTGAITFAPALDLRPRRGPAPIPLAAVPPAGKGIRLWYRTGGGAAGNVAAGRVTNLRDPIPGVRVTNPQPARGGREIEPIESVMARGPHEFYALRRAVTARDFELCATAGSGSIARAKAFTRASHWSFAEAGEVEVVLVPHVGAEARPEWRLPMQVLVDHQVPDARARTERDLNERRALGTSCLASWARYKAVSIAARVIVRSEEDLDAVRNRIHDRLRQTLSPLPTPLNPTGWPFGEPLRASNVYRLLEQAEPGVRYVEDVRFVVEEAPDQRVRAVAADPHQSDTWFAACGEVLFRSTNGGVGWEPAGRFPGEETRRVEPAPAPVRPGMTAHPGWVAVVTRRADGSGSGVHLSTDLGETWHRVAELQAGISDLAWIDRGGAAALLLATDVGLYELALMRGAVPLQVIIDPADPDRGFYGVRAFVSEHGAVGVAAAAQAQYGVYLSTEGGRAGSFGAIGLDGVDVRTLDVQFDGPATVLWAGSGEADLSRPGSGCFRTRLFESDVRWEQLSTGWGGGTCWSLAFVGTTAYAATQSGGVLRLDTAATQPAWDAPEVNCGLPLRDRPRFEAVETVATAGADDPVIVGSPRGVYRSVQADRWAPSANRETRDSVTVPDTWLLVSGEHQIEVSRATADH